MDDEEKEGLVVVGSMNPSKIEAVRKTIWATHGGKLMAPGFHVCRKVIGFGARSTVREQPMGLDEITHGARSRALHALAEHPNAIAFGIESGVFLQRVRPTEVPPCERLFDICACVVVARGREEALGFSSAWALPKDVSDLIVRGHGRVTMDDALVETGRTTDPRLGYGGGGILLLSNGRIDRTTYTAQAVVAALIDWDKPQP